MAEVVGEVVVRRVAEKEPEVVPALELVRGKAAFGDMHLKGLLMGLRCRKVLHTLFWQPLPAVFSSFQVCSRFHVFMVFLVFFSFSFLPMWVILVSLMLLLSLLLLGSVALSWLLALLLVLLLLLLLVQAPWLGLEVGMQLNFFPLFGGTPPFSGSPRTSPLCHLFWAGPDSGPGPPLSY